MNTRRLELILVTVLAVIYHLLFWQEKFGLNLLLFSSVLTALALVRNRQNVLRPTVIITVIGTITSGASVILYDSLMAKIIHLLSFPVMLGFIYQGELRSIYYALSSAVANFLTVPKRLLYDSSVALNKKYKLNWLWRFMKLFFIPLMTFCLFLLIYNFASPFFGEYVALSFTWLNEVFSFIWETISFSHLLFWVLGILIITGSLFDARVRSFVDQEGRLSDLMKRVRKTKPLGPTVDREAYMRLHGKKNPLGLKREAYVSIMLMVLVNLLLVAVNFIDIETLWYGFKVPIGFSLKQFVHEGTFLLIFSILLSMGILLYFFRGNQNFYAKNKWLKRLAYVWIAQNVLLVISVFLRNYHYIDYHGLAYRRIGVIAFLLLTAVGLVTLLLKIQQRKSFYYLLRVNSWAVYLVLVAMCFVNWDVHVVNYNLGHHRPNEIDIDNYLELSPRVYPILYANLHVIEQQMRMHQNNRQVWVEHTDPFRFHDALDRKRELYLSEWLDYGWPSWTLADAETLEAFKDEYQNLQALRQASEARQAAYAQSKKR